MTKETLERALHQLDLQELDVAVYAERHRFTAIVTTPDFTDMDEAERQRIVWGHLRAFFSDHELVRIEFIFTNSPEDDTAAESAQ